MLAHLWASCVADRRAAIAASACVVAVLTYIVCIAITVSNGTYIGGLSFPYFSDTGRDMPAYAVFSVGLTATCLLYIPLHLYILREVKATEVKATEAGTAGAPSCCCGRPCGGGSRCSTACQATGAAACAIVSAPFLSVLAIADTAFHADLHQYAAYLFFLLNVVSVALYRHVFNSLALAAASAAGGEAALAARHARSSNVKRVLSYCFYAAFLLYLPIGIAVNCAFVRLPMAACVNELKLGARFCAERALASNATLTVLWDYTPCLGTNTMRSVSQFFSIVSLLLFNGSFMLDFGKDEERANAVAGDELEGQLQTKAARIAVEAGL